LCQKKKKEKKDGVLKFCPQSVEAGQEREGEGRRSDEKGQESRRAGEQESREQKTRR
jgi:hypothetical protein